MSVEFSSKYPMTKAEERALRFAREWYRHPDVQDALWCDGVNLGEMLEYDVYLPVYQILEKHLGNDA